jgi:polysaccharide export outer membrane protein
MKTLSIPFSRVSRAVARRARGAASVTAAVTALVAPVLASTALAQSDYIVGPRDVLAVTVFEQPELSGKFTIEADGSFSFPLLGRLTVAGLKTREVESVLRERLLKGILTDPRVVVAVDQYGSQRVFLVGQVRSPGSYQLNGDMTLIELLARAGSIIDGAGPEAVIVRPRTGRASTGTPIDPENPGNAEVIRVDLDALHRGRLDNNVLLRDGDTIVVPRVELITVYVQGHVKNPGVYTVPKNARLVQVLAMAGGVSERGSAGRVKLTRVQDGKTIERKLKADEPLQDGDTLTVGRRLL